MLVAAVFAYNCPKLEATQCPSAGEWVKKLWYIHQWNTPEQSRGMNGHSNNVEESQTHYAE